MFSILWSFTTYHNAYNIAQYHSVSPSSGYVSPHVYVSPDSCQHTSLHGRVFILSLEYGNIMRKQLAPSLATNIRPGACRLAG